MVYIYNIFNMIRLYIVYYFFVIILREVIRLTFTFPRMPRTAPADLPSQLGLDGLRPVSQTVQQGTTRADSCNTTTSAASSSTGSTATESQSRSRSAVESVDDEVQENGEQGR